MRVFTTKKLMLGVAAAGVLAFGGVQATKAQAQPAPVVAPAPATALTGTVLRYYVGRSGYVTAVDLQTSSGVKIVRFAPSAASQLTATYPVGSTATIYVTTWEGRNYLAGWGPNMPSPTATFEPYTVTDLDVLKSSPYTVIGAKQQRVTGKLTGFIKDDSGEVLAIVLDKNKLVRIPAENRQGSTRDVPDGLTPLLKRADVVVVAVPEFVPYGTVSPYESRWVASAVSVDGQTLGAKGFGKLPVSKGKTLLGFDLSLGPILTGSTPEEIQAGQMGYYTYLAPAAK